MENKTDNLDDVKLDEAIRMLYGMRKFAVGNGESYRKLEIEIDEYLKQVKYAYNS